MRIREWKITAGPSEEVLSKALSVDDYLNKEAYDFHVTASNDKTCREKRQIAFDKIRREMGSTSTFTFSGWGSVVGAEVKMVHACRGSYDASTQTGTYVEFYTT